MVWRPTTFLVWANCKLLDRKKTQQRLVICLHHVYKAKVECEGNTGFFMTKDNISPSASRVKSRISPTKKCSWISEYLSIWYVPPFCSINVMHLSWHGLHKTWLMLSQHGLTVFHNASGDVTVWFSQSPQVSPHMFPGAWDQMTVEGGPWQSGLLGLQVVLVKTLKWEDIPKTILF